LLKNEGGREGGREGELECLFPLRNRFGYDGGLPELGDLNDAVPHHPESESSSDAWREGGKEGRREGG